MRATNVVMLASLSKDKFSEYQDLFKAYPEFELKPLSELVFNARHLSDAESGKTYYENAFIKGQLAHLAVKVPTISDDTGLEVDALNGKPGLRSHRYAIARAGETQDMANVKKLLDELKSVPTEKRTARFVCCLIFFVEGLVATVTEKLEGTLLTEPRGKNGFGYDPLFVPQGSSKTLAEMSSEEKNHISHRAKALRALMEQVKESGVHMVRP